MTDTVFKGTHRRYNPLREEWVLVSPGRTARPWQGAREVPAAPALPEFDPQCYLCPGNARANDARNPAYSGCYVFDNDFAALNPQEQPPSDWADGLLAARSEAGVCRVICYSPRHDLSLSGMDNAAQRQVVDCWCAQSAELGARDDINHVQVFENRGAAMGCSNPHPHGQVWAQGSIPSEPARELASMRAYHRRQGSSLLPDYLEQELALGERVVFEESGFVVLVPFWAVWPFETIVLPRGNVARMPDLSSGLRDSLAVTLGRLLRIYDALFDCPFPYSMGIHQAPTDGLEHAGFTLHTHFYPPLLRSAEVRKFMVGYEMLAEAQRDLSPEASAAALREAAERLHD